MKTNGCYAIVFLIVFVSTCVQGQTNGEYALNDPRNPDCPCHKYQQQAEREYAQNKVSGKEIPESDEWKVAGTSAIAVRDVQHKEVGQKQSSGRVSTRGKQHQLFLKQRFRVMNKYKRRRKVKPNYAVCYRW